MYNDVDISGFLSFIKVFESDDLFGKFLEYHNSTLDEYYDFYNLGSPSDVDRLMSDIFNFLYDLDGIEEVVSYCRENYSTHLEIRLRRIVHFKGYSFVVPVTIDSKSFDEYYGKVVFSS